MPTLPTKSLDRQSHGSDKYQVKRKVSRTRKPQTAEQKSKYARAERERQKRRREELAIPSIPADIDRRLKAEFEPTEEEAARMAEVIKQATAEFRKQIPIRNN